LDKQKKSTFDQSKIEFSNKEKTVTIVTTAFKADKIIDKKYLGIINISCKDEEQSEDQRI
jgi:hypothetical protein